jgi:hypothetical protein
MVVALSSLTSKTVWVHWEMIEKLVIDNPARV